MDEKEQKKKFVKTNVFEDFPAFSQKRYEPRNRKNCFSWFMSGECKEEKRFNDFLILRFTPSDKTHISGGKG